MTKENSLGRGKAIELLKMCISKLIRENIPKEDFTCILKNTPENRPLLRDGEFSVNESFDNKDGEDNFFDSWVKNARVCVCSSDKNRSISITVRASYDKSKMDADELSVFNSFTAKSKPPIAADSEPITIKDLKDYNRINQTYTRVIFDNLKSLGLYRDSLPGLIVISGRTNCAKTVVVKSIIQKYIETYPGNNGVHHIVTCEDPIESLNVSNKESDKVHYTPREIGKDVRCLSEALKDAKRQTPSCVFVGEVRTDDDWRNVIDFAGTGHFIITTTHAGSLLETFAKIFKAARVKTSFDRRYVAGNILSCIHLRSKIIESTGCSLSIPSAWFKTCESINEIVSHGIASLSPNGRYSLGRRHFAQMLNFFSAQDAALKLGTELDIEELFR